ncbi:hypothetical protein MTO96_024887 [Rhipicephalus appendiculatus]
MVLTNALSTAFRPSAAAVQHLYPPILLLTFAPNPGASIAKGRVCAQDMFLVLRETRDAFEKQDVPHICSRQYLLFV